MKKIYIVILLLLIISCNDPGKEIFDQRYKSRVNNKNKFLNEYGFRSEKHRELILRDKVCRGMTYSDVILSISYLYDEMKEMRDKRDNSLLLFGIKNGKRKVVYYFKDNRLVKWNKLKR